MVMQLTLENKSQIELHAKSTLPYECCGLVLNINGNQIIKPCQNVASNPINSFVIDSNDLQSVDLDNIIAFYHSHPKGSSFSLSDIYFAEKLKKNCVLYSEGEFSIYEPNGMKIPYVDRPFFVGYLDCFTLFKDYYERELNIHLPDANQKDRYNHLNWEKLAQSKEYENNTILYDYCKENNFSEVKDIKKHDVLLLKLPFTKTFPLHIGIMIEKDKILHHLFEFSSIESYNHSYKRLTTNIFRHNSLL